MIKFDKVTFKYPGFVMGELNFEIKKGEFVSIVGNNACGKSTLINLMAGLLKPQKGEILLDGKKPKDFNALGVVFQNPDNQIIFNTVSDDIEFTLKHRKFPKSEFKQRIEKALQLVHLEGFEKAETNTLSTGQKQRLVIANMLACDPQILLLDETSVYLDSQAKQDFFRLLLELKQQGITIICTTNELSEIVYSDRTMILSKGQIVDFKTREELIADLSVFEKLDMFVPLKLRLLAKYKIYDQMFDEDIIKQIK